MIVYVSGTPGLVGGLPEELLPDTPANVMMSFVEIYYQRGACLRRFLRILKARKATGVNPSPPRNTTGRCRRR